MGTYKFNDAGWWATVVIGTYAEAKYLAALRYMREKKAKYGTIYLESVK
jgi:hypothetical protein